MSAIRQTNFLGGELAPLLHGRTDHPAFAKGARTMRNFFASKHGAAVSRPGTLYVAEVTLGLGTVPRLLPFVYGDDLAFVVEMGVTAGGLLFFRFYANGARVEGSALDAIYEVTSTIAATDLDLVKLAQVGSVLTLVSPEFVPQELRRFADWTAAALGADAYTADMAGESAATIAFAGGASNAASQAAYEAAYTAAYDALFVYAPAARAAALAAAQAAAAASLAIFNDFLLAGDDFSNTHNVVFFGHMLGTPHWSLTPVAFSARESSWRSTYPPTQGGNYPVLLSPLPTPGASTPEREWEYLCNLTAQDTATGRYFQTKPWRVTSKWDGNIANLPVPLTSELVAVYPDKPVTIRRDHAGVSPLNLTDNTYRVVAMNVFRGRGGLFGYLGSTESDAFVDVGAEPDWTRQPLFGTNPFTTEDYLGVETTENPHSVGFYQDKRCFGGTTKRPNSWWGSGTGDYTDFDPHPIYPVAGEALEFDLASQRYEEIRHLAPAHRLLIGTSASWWTLSGSQDYPLDFESINVKLEDPVGTTHLAPLMVGESLIFARAKGVGVRALSLNQYGEYRGRDVSVQSDHLFVGEEDLVVPVFGGVAERLSLVDWAYAEDPWGVIWAVRSDGVFLSATPAGEALAWARHDTNGNVVRVCAIPEGDEDAVYLLVSRLGGYYLERMTSRVRVGSVEDDACVDCGLRFRGAPTLTITGLDHLEGEAVYVVGKDNPPRGPYTVAAGQITLEELPTANGLAADRTPDVTLFIGTLFQADLELLDVVTTDTKLKMKAVTRIGFEVDQSVGLKGGQDFDHLDDTRPNTVVSGYEPPVPGTQLIIVTPQRRWDAGGRAVLRQSLPLPVTVVGVVRELEVGG